MAWAAIATMIGVGLGAGVVGGMFGIGGGLIIVPTLVLAFGYDQKTATGTSLLAQLLPVAILAVRQYWIREEINVPSGLGIAVGLTFGTLLGSILTGTISPAAMKRIYGIFLIVVGAYFLLASGPKPTKVPMIPDHPMADQVH